MSDTIIYCLLSDTSVYCLSQLLSIVLHYYLLSTDYEQEALNMHNKFRKVHGSQPMTLNKQMCQEAQAYAEKIAASGAMQHSSRQEREGQGENLSMGCSSSKGGQTATEAVTNW